MGCAWYAPGREGAGCQHWSLGGGGAKVMSGGQKQAETKTWKALDLGFHF